MSINGSRPRGAEDDPRAADELRDDELESVVGGAMPSPPAGSAGWLAGTPATDDVPPLPAEPL